MRTHRPANVAPNLGRQPTPTVFVYLTKIEHTMLQPLCGFGLFMLEKHPALQARITDEEAAQHEVAVLALAYLLDVPIESMRGEVLKLVTRDPAPKVRVVKVKASPIVAPDGVAILRPAEAPPAPAEEHGVFTLEERPKAKA